MTDYQRGVEQASRIYQEVIDEYVAENDKLRNLVYDMWDELAPYATANGISLTRLHERMDELTRD